MSLEPSLINGYGIDIADYKNDKYSEALDYLNRNFYDLADEIDNTPCVYDTAVNTDEFTNVIYIPATVPVNLGNKIRIFTIEEANLLRTGDNVSFKATIVNGQSTGNVEKFKNNDL